MSIYDGDFVPRQIIDPSDSFDGTSADAGDKNMTLAQIDL